MTIEHVKYFSDGRKPQVRVIDEQIESRRVAGRFTGSIYSRQEDSLHILHIASENKEKGEPCEVTVFMPTNPDSVSMRHFVIDLKGDGTFTVPLTRDQNLKKDQINHVDWGDNPEEIYRWRKTKKPQS